MAKKSRPRSRSRTRSASTRKSAPSSNAPSSAPKKSASSSSSSSSLLAKIKASIPPVPFTLPEGTVDLFDAVLKEAPKRATRVVAQTRSKLAHPRPGILNGDEERHVAIAVLGAALLLWLGAAVFGAVAGDGGACVAGGKKGISSSSSPSSLSLAAAASCVRGGKLPLLWFDGVLRSLGPLLTLPLLLSRLAVARGSATISGRISPAARPLAHFAHVFAVYSAAAAARLGLYLPHRSGLLARGVEWAAWSVSLPFRAVSGILGRAAPSPSPSPSPLALARGLASRAAAAAAPVSSLLPFGFPSSSSSSSPTTTTKTRHLMSDHLFLGSCVGAVLVAEGVLLVLDARRHKKTGGGGGVTRALLLAGAAACALLYGALCADMAFTAAYFHARHETAAAVAAGLVAFQAPLGVWLLGGVAGAKRAASGFVGRVLR